VAEGDLSVQIVGGGSDETGLLLRAIQRMTTNLNDLIGQVKKSSINVISSATTIAAASKSQEAVAHELGSATTEISAATAEISVTANELVRTMSDVSGMVVETADMARAGHARIEGMDATMRDLSTGADSISTSLSVISDRAQNITGIVTTITKVADQTNLLSLNAAIEAVKAREYGQGFSVVADEIRRLADQTAVAALDIEQIVEEMLGSVSTGIAEMDRFRVQVHKGVDTMEQVSLQLVSIIDRVQDLLPRFGQVNESMQSQSIGVEQISTAMLSLKQVAHSTTSSIGDLNLAVGGLHEAVKALREEVSTFKVQE
jgi:methyl-accepting chemotaxis protein WspA